jgi:hypothetical protein
MCCWLSEDIPVRFLTLYLSSVSTDVKRLCYSETKKWVAQHVALSIRRTPPTVTVTVAILKIRSLL